MRLLALPLIQKDAANAHSRGHKGTRGQGDFGHEGQADKGHKADRAHHHQDLGRDKGDIRLLCLGCQNGVERDALGPHVLGHLLAELLQNLFTVAAFFQQVQTTVYLAVHADRFSKENQINTLHHCDDGREDDDVDDRFCRKHDALLRTEGFENLRR